MSPRRARRDKPPAPPQPTVPAKAVAVAKWGGNMSLAAAAAMSAQTLYRLGRVLGYAWWNAWLLPVSLDVYAATAIWVGNRVPDGHKARKSARSNARIALFLTVGANGLFHLLNLPGVHLPSWIATTLLVLVSALPPFVVERILHLQMAVSTGRAPTASDTADADADAATATADNSSAKTPPAPAANRPVPTPPAANANPTPTANRQPAPVSAANGTRPPAANPKPDSANDNAGTETLVAAMLPAYRQLLADTGKRPTAPQLVAAVDGLNTDSRAKQIREIVERRFPDLAPRLRAVEPVGQAV